MCHFDFCFCFSCSSSRFLWTSCNFSFNSSNEWGGLENLNILSIFLLRFTSRKISLLDFFILFGGQLGKKRMAGVDGFEGVKPIDDVRVDVFEMGHHFCNETGFFGRWCGGGWRIVMGDKDGFQFLLWVGLPLCKSCFCLSFRFLDEFFVFLVQWVNKWWIGSDVDSLFQRRDEIPVGSVLCNYLSPFWWNDVLNLICWIWIGRRSCELDEHINIIIQLSFVLPNINLHLLIPHFVRDFTITSWLFSESSFFIISFLINTYSVIYKNRNRLKSLDKISSFSIPHFPKYLKIEVCSK